MQSLTRAFCRAFTGLSLAVLAAPAWGADDPVVGRWDLTLGNGPTPSWVEITKQTDKYTGSFLGTGGSPGNLKEIKVDGNKVEFKVGGKTWTATIKGDTLAGVYGKENNMFTGRRFVPRLDLNGDWAFEGRKTVLALKQQSKRLAGYLVDGKERQQLQDVKLNGYALSFVADGRQYTSTVKGDVLEGTKTASGKQEEFTAVRNRKWGQPIELFNGKDTTGWKPLGKPENFKWKVEDGILHCPGGSANIVTERTFKDFKLHVEFRLSQHSNSGVYLRGRHEIQVADSAGEKLNEHMCGALYGRVAPSENATRPAGEWQTFDITIVDHCLTVVQNGKTIINNQEIVGITGGAIDSNENEPGPIYLQGDHSAIDYRKVTIAPAVRESPAPVAG